MCFLVDCSPFCGCGTRQAPNFLLSVHMRQHNRRCFFVYLPNQQGCCTTRGLTGTSLWRGGCWCAAATAWFTSWWVPLFGFSGSSGLAIARVGAQNAVEGKGAASRGWRCWCCFSHFGRGWLSLPLASISNPAQVHIPRPILRIPMLAIHLQRELAEKGFNPNKQTQARAEGEGQGAAGRVRERLWDGRKQSVRV